MHRPGSGGSGVRRWQFSVAAVTVPLYSAWPRQAYSAPGAWCLVWLRLLTAPPCGRCCCCSHSEDQETEAQRGTSVNLHAKFTAPRGRGGLAPESSHTACALRLPGALQCSRKCPLPTLQVSHGQQAWGRQADPARGTGLLRLSSGASWALGPVLCGAEARGVCAVVFCVRSV